MQIDTKPPVKSATVSENIRDGLGRACDLRLNKKALKIFYTLTFGSVCLFPVSLLKAAMRAPLIPFDIGPYFLIPCQKKLKPGEAEICLLSIALYIC
jgi:hypothetical protein